MDSEADLASLAAKASDDILSICVFGASGDLAKKKLFPALYQLCLLGHIPRQVNILGYGRSAVDLPAFIAKQCVNIKEQPALPKAEFRTRISFHTGPYDSPESFRLLAQELTAYKNLSYDILVPLPDGSARWVSLDLLPKARRDDTIELTSGTIEVPELQRRLDAP